MREIGPYGRLQRQRQPSLLFDRFSRSLAATVPGMTDTFRCPLCWRDFDQGSLKSGALSREHVPPRSLGGWLVTLTCKKCNNR